MAKSLHQGGKSVILNFHFFVEEPSAKTAFDILLPKILPENIPFQVYSHQGKQDLEKAIKSTVPSISKIPGARIMILRDQDSGNCKTIKTKINNLISENCASPYLIRIVCKELESWFLGDLPAIKNAFNRFKPENYQGKKEFRDVDSIQKPNELLLSIIPEYKLLEHLPKIETAESIAPFLSLEKNTSTSFVNFLNGIEKLKDMEN